MALLEKMQVSGSIANLRYKQFVMIRQEAHNLVLVSSAQTRVRGHKYFALALKGNGEHIDR
jgi:hypothetical protein